ncbi:MAG: hypothetical protein V1800_15660 [Candidatus Latescibacterota bacterium]
MPRIAMPLFGFECEQITDYQFGDTGISIEQFIEDDIVESPIFSQQDILHMKNEPGFAFIFENENIEGYESLTNLLLMSFKIFCEIRSPLIKFRICRDDTSLCRLLNDTISYNYSFPRPIRAYRLSEIEVINEGFQALSDMDRISRRTHNALYFLYRAFHSTKWMDAYILLMCSIESLFSKDKPGSATSAITTRVSSLLNSRPQCTKKDIEDLYGIRSRIIHGNIAGPRFDVEIKDRKANLKNLKHLEYVAIECFKEFAKNGLYRNYTDKSTRDDFLGTLDITS